MEFFLEEQGGFEGLFLISSEENEIAAYCLSIKSG